MSQVGTVGDPGAALLSRRALLRAAGAGAGVTAAALAGCAGAGAALSINVPELARRLSGPLITPNQPGYQLARRSFNPLLDTRAPAAIAQCWRIEDVQACVSAAAAARSGGHSYAGYSTPDDGLVVDLSSLAGSTDAWPRLALVLSGRAIDWELIERNYDQMAKYATALRLGTAEPEQRHCQLDDEDDQDRSPDHEP